MTEFRRALALQYVDKDDDLWVPRPDDYWVFLSCRCGQHPWSFAQAEEEWKTGRNEPYKNRATETVMDQWGPLHKYVHLIEEQP